MIRFVFPIIVLTAVMSAGACSGRDPVADEVNQLAAAPTNVGMLPPDESAATPTNEQDNGIDDPTPPPAEAGKIPASLHGRWGMTPADCTSTRGDAKGLLTVSADSLRFYESVAKPAADVRTSDNSVSGNFAFTGEGMTWTKFEALELQRGKLVRTESDPMTSYTYARCVG